MSGRDEQAGALEDRWAAQHLDLPPEASAAQVRAHALKRLTEEDFSLTPETRWAMWVAVKSSSLATHRPAAEADWSQQQFLKGEVEQFAAEFFSLSCDARKRRWRELSLATEQSPHLARRVQQLGPGLGVELSGIEQADGFVRDLGLLAAKLFVLPDAARAAARQMWLAEHEKQLRIWSLMSTRLEREHENFFQLAPDLFRSIEDWRSREARATDQKVEIARLTRQESVPRRSLSSDWAEQLWVVRVLIIFAVIAFSRVQSCDAPNRYRSIPSLPPSTPELDQKALESLQEFLRKHGEKRWPGVHQPAEQPDPAEQTSPIPPERSEPAPTREAEKPMPDAVPPPASPPNVPGQP